jgi:hypothetical protein
MSTRHTQQGAGRPKTYQNIDIDDIMNLVDEHLAWQVEPPSQRNSWDEYQQRQAEEGIKLKNRRGSQGTLVVDYDFETGEVKAFHRKYEKSIVSEQASTKASQHPSYASVKKDEVHRRPQAKYNLFPKSPGASSQPLLDVFPEPPPSAPKTHRNQLPSLIS